MEKPADILPESFSEFVTPPSGEVREDDHHYARKRALAYLKTLDVPEQKAAAFAAEALRRAEREQGRHPVAATMQALRAVLSEGQNAEGYDAQPGELASMPPLNRASMLSEELDRKPWWTFFTKHILRRK